MKKIAIILLLIFLGGGFGYWKFKDEKKTNDKIMALQKQVANLTDSFNKLQNQKQNLSQTEVINREIIREKSQDQMLTEAVSKNSPAVVSIVASKDMPQMEIVYGNPFGDDPFFQDFGIRVPMYRQKGVSKQKVGAGTGFLIRKNGYILTNRHVVADAQAEYTALLSDGSQKTAQVVYRDEALDIALLKIEGDNFKIAVFGDSGSLQLGQAVIAIGNALGEYNNSVSTGIISGLNRNLEAGGEQLSGVIQTDAAINPGNSGGPLLTLKGEVIGVNVATTQGASNISFSIPINQIKPVLKQVIGN